MRGLKKPKKKNGLIGMETKENRMKFARRAMGRGGGAGIGGEESLSNAA